MGPPCYFLNTSTVQVGAATGDGAGDTEPAKSWSSQLSPPAGGGGKTMPSYHTDDHAPVTSSAGGQWQAPGAPCLGARIQSWWPAWTSKPSEHKAVSVSQAEAPGQKESCISRKSISLRVLPRACVSCALAHPGRAWLPGCHPKLDTYLLSESRWNTLKVWSKCC